MFRLAGRAIHVVRRVSLARERGSLHRERGSDTQTARALLSGPEGSPGQAAVLEWWVAASAAVRQGTCQHGPGASSLASRARAARRAWWKTSSLRPLGLLALRRPLSAPDLAQGCSEHRPASANHSVGRAGRPYRPWFPHRCERGRADGVPRDAPAAQVELLVQRVERERAWVCRAGLRGAAPL